MTWISLKIIFGIGGEKGYPGAAVFLVGPYLGNLKVPRDKRLVVSSLYKLKDLDRKMVLKPAFSY